MNGGHELSYAVEGLFVDAGISFDERLIVAALVDEVIDERRLRGIALQARLCSHGVVAEGHYAL